ncbi:transposase [Candidatus Orientia mediorientalis]|uniref:transposase n=1 Tax=Candidatus Orientia mediorientalis TaxID=911112 RepID=UPI000A7088B9|nr:transposase [Candidatus Orientia mediorientalis]
MTVILFNGWVKHDLIPKLPNNSVVVMDNASFHKSPYLKTVLDKEGHTANTNSTT